MSSIFLWDQCPHFIHKLRMYRLKGMTSIYSTQKTWFVLLKSEIFRLYTWSTLQGVAQVRGRNILPRAKVGSIEWKPHGSRIRFRLRSGLFGFFSFHRFPLGCSWINFARITIELVHRGSGWGIFLWYFCMTIIQTYMSHVLNTCSLNWTWFLYIFVKCLCENHVWK